MCVNSQCQGAIFDIPVIGDYITPVGIPCSGERELRISMRIVLEVLSCFERAGKKRQAERARERDRQTAREQARAMQRDSVN